MNKYKFDFGPHADIWRGKWVENESGRVTEVTVKVLRSVQPSSLINFLHASRRWSIPCHPNVTPFLGITFDFHRPGTPCLVLPFYQHGNITNYVKKHLNVDKASLLSQAASGLSYLHDLSIIHGDVKGSNILINDNGQACITDFCLSRTMQSIGVTTQMVPGALRYMAPELINCPDEDEEFVLPTKETDVWAFSMTAIEIFTGSEPFPRIKNDIRVTMFVVKGGHPDRYRCKLINDEIWVMLQRCWEADPSRRPSMVDLARFFSEHAASAGMPCARL